MDETTVCLTESRMTNISNINTGPEQSVCECYVYIMCIYYSVARFRNYYLNSAKCVSKVRSVLGVFFFFTCQTLPGSTSLSRIRSRICLVGELGNDSKTFDAAQVTMSYFHKTKLYQNMCMM
jgi:hypothetical protein